MELVAVVNPFRYVRFVKAYKRLKEETEIYHDIIDLSCEAELWGIIDEELFDLIEDAEVAVRNALDRDKKLCVDSCIWKRDDFSFGYVF